MTSKVFPGEIRIMARMCFAAFLRFLIPGLALTALLLVGSLLQDGRTAVFLRDLSPVPLAILVVAGAITIGGKTLRFLGKRAKAHAH